MIIRYVINSYTLYNTLLHLNCIMKINIVIINAVFQNRVMLGSDYPFPLGEHHPGKLIESVQDMEEELKVSGRHAVKEDSAGHEKCVCLLSSVHANPEFNRDIFQSCSQTV